MFCGSSVGLQYVIVAFPDNTHLLFLIIEPVHEISNIVVCVTSKVSDQPVHMRSLIRALASRLNIL